MQMPGPSLFLAGALLFCCSSVMAQAAPTGDAVRGREIYISHGCYQCHGYQGQGSNAGSRVAPDPAPYTAFSYQVRQPRGRMPAYALKILPDKSLADIYAYLRSIPKPKAVADIPLLSGAR